MNDLAGMIEREGRGALPRENFGLPSLDLMDMQGIETPYNHEVTGVLGDILMCEIADETKDGEVTRNGIIIPQEMSTKMWRVAKVVMTGPQCSGSVKVGDFVMYPSDKGLPMISLGKKYIFLNESRIFCICKPCK